MPLAFTPRSTTARIPAAASERSGTALRIQVLLLLLSALLLTTALHAQRCLDLDITALMGQHLHVPGDPAANYAACKTKINEHRQAEIVNYGDDLVQLDSLLNRTGRRFNAASAASMMGNAPSAQTEQDAQELAEKLQKMTPEQKQAWAMQYAARQMQATQAPAMQEDPQMLRSFGDVNTLNTRMYTLNSAFSLKANGLLNEEQAALDKVPEPDVSVCPGVDKVGFPSCACLNGVYAKHWARQLAIEAKYDAEINTLIDQQIKQVKPLVVQAEADISALHNGEALHNPRLKQSLVAYQMGIFDQAFEVTSAIEKVRESSSDLYVKKVNADNKVFSISCD